MIIKKLERKATILCAMGYYDMFCGFPVLKIQLRYDDAIDGKRERYQVIFFQFNKESELESCICDLRTVCGFKHLIELKNRSVNVCMYQEEHSTYEDNVELIRLEDRETNRIWFPKESGIADILCNEQTLFVY